jgi:hypothetical protein
MQAAQNTFSALCLSALQLVLLWKSMGSCNDEIEGLESGLLAVRPVSLFMPFAESVVSDLEYVSEITIHLELDYKEDPEPFAEELPHTLAKILSSISRIEKMTCIINEDRAHLFSDAFYLHNLVFPTVKKLIVGPYNDYAVKHCPNVEFLSVSDQVWLHSKKGRPDRQHSFNLIEKAGTLSHVQIFFMMEWWTEDLLIGMFISSISSKIYACYSQVDQKHFTMQFHT